MSDRIIDELNPDAHLSSKEVHSLICDEEEDPAPISMSDLQESFDDSVMRTILRTYSALLTKAPFSHESLLIDRKDKKLSSAEKKLAERAYKLEKTSKITYSRPSYAAFYPKPLGRDQQPLASEPTTGTHRSHRENDSSAIGMTSRLSATNTCSGGGSAHWPPKTTMANPTTCNTHDHFDTTLSRPSYTSGSTRSTLAHAAFPTPTFSNVLAAQPRIPARNNVKAGRIYPQQHLSSDKSDISVEKVTSQVGTSSNTQVANALSKQGVGIHQLTVAKDVTIPTSQHEPSINLKSGQIVLVIKTPKGIYLKMEEKIIKIKQQVAMSSLFEGSPDSLSSALDVESL